MLHVLDGWFETSEDLFYEIIMAMILLDVV